jgi:hypothetical protein
MNDLKLTSMLQGHFSAKGLEISVNQLEDGLIQFKDDVNIVAAYIAKPEHYTARNAFLNLMLKAASRINEYNQTYLVAPKLYGPMLDVKQLSTTGMGLILYDEREIYEAYPARFFQRTSQNQPSGLNEVNAHLTAEIQRLRDEVEWLKKDLVNLRVELEKLRERRIVEKAVEPLNPIESQTYGDTLPSFFKDNPWITVLSNRGADLT